MTVALAAPTTTQTTHLTLNCVSQCTFLNDPNMTTSTAITYQGNLLWTTQTTSTNTTQKLSEDVSSGPVTLKAGSEIHERISGTSVIITYTGVIIDGGSENNLQGTQIGVFTTAS